MMPFKAVIFDLDGVITQTALVHSRAWKEVFDVYLETRTQRDKESHAPFDSGMDYLSYVDGKPRYEGVKSFLASRGITLPFGTPDDSPEMETICGIGNRKNLSFNAILARDGVAVYPSTVELIHRLKREGIRVGVASSSKNCRYVLEVTGLAPLIETRVDGEVSAELGLKGKPDPDIFTRAADNLGVSYHECVVVEDAISGVEAGKKGNFGLVLGIAREENEAALYAGGADIVVKDIAEIGFEGIVQWFQKGLDADHWHLIYHDYRPENERSREALLTVGNGYFGTRGAMEEVPVNPVNYPGTYISGVYNKLPSKVSGREVWNEDFVNVPNWLPVTFRIDDGDWFDVNQTTILSIRRDLNLRNGLLTRQMIVRDRFGHETSIVSRRLASMENPNIGALEYTITPLNYAGEIQIKSALSGIHINDGVARYKDLNQKHMTPVDEWVYGDLQQIEVATTASGIAIRQTARVRFFIDQQPVDAEISGNCTDGVAELILSTFTERNQALTLEKLVCIEDQYADIPWVTNPVEELHGAGSFDKILQASADAWSGIWQKMDIRVEGDRLAQKLLRLHLYHLICTTSPNNTNIDFGIPARGLTGEAYRGHIFWDELYILPLYFIHFPEVAKSILMYRYRRLNAARAYAKANRYKGAMYPWQSGSSGEEETQLFHFNPLSGSWGDDHSSLQRHVSLAIAWNIIQYHQHTNDLEFLGRYGMEMLVEICRFWAKKARKNRATGRYSIDKVMGPDEFHESYPGAKMGGIRDNAYTNVMVSWMFSEVSSLLPKLDSEAMLRLSKKIRFKTVEAHTWQHIGSHLNLVISDEGIIAQYDGYFELEEIDFDHYRQKYGNIYRLDRILKAEGKSPDQYKVSKQADTLMLFYNLPPETVTSLITNMGYQLPKDYIKRNLEYYIQRTSHGSTLSRVVHAYLATLIGKDDLAWELYRDALTSDFNDIQGGTTAEGIHNGVMAGTVMIALKAYGGLNLYGDIPEIHPNLPEPWRSLSFSFGFRNERYSCIIEDQEAHLTKIE
jgi:beta-phosphoglucomutase family hydrolase